MSLGGLSLPCLTVTLALCLLWLSRGDPCTALSSQIAASDYGCLDRKKQAVLMAWTNWISWRRFRTQLSHFLWLSKAKHTLIRIDWDSHWNTVPHSLLVKLVCIYGSVKIQLSTYNCACVVYFKHCTLFINFWLLCSLEIKDLHLWKDVGLYEQQEEHRFG